MFHFRKKRSYSNVSNAQGIVKIFRLAAKLQLFVYNNDISFKLSKLIVGHIQRFVLGRKVTLPANISLHNVIICHGGSLPSPTPSLVGEIAMCVMRCSILIQYRRERHE